MQGELDESEASSTRPLPWRRAAAMRSAPTQRGKGVKIMAIVDRHGLPLAVSTHAANHHEVTLVQLSFDFYMIEAKPENLIGDRAYDSDQLDGELREDGVEMIAPHRSNRCKPHTRWSPPAAIRASLARRTLLCLASVEAPASCAMGVLPRQFPRLRAACLHHYAAQAILRSNHIRFEMRGTMQVSDRIGRRSEAARSPRSHGCRAIGQHG